MRSKSIRRQLLIDGVPPSRSDQSCSCCSADELHRTNS